MTRNDIIAHINHIKEKLLMAITDDLAALEASIARVEGDESALKAKVTDLENQVAAGAQAVTDLATANQTIADAEAKIQALTAQLDALAPPA